jgi:hypothetical protein
MEATPATAVFPSSLWLASLISAVLCAGASLLWLVSPRVRIRAVGIGLTVISGTLIVLLGAELLGDADRVANLALRPWHRFFAVTAMFAAGVLIALGATLGRKTGGRARQLAAPIGLLIVSLALVAASMWRIEKPLLNDIAQSKFMQNTVSDLAAPQISSDGEFALTDLGRKIPLEQFLTNEELLNEEETERRIPADFKARVIVDDSEPSPSNCHGWVFTDGRYLIRGRYVDAILNDNGYQIVTDAHVGDLIIYRDAAGEPIHTGIVKATGDNGFVLIESKWGALDIYLHLPQDQVYSQGYAYYRSTRDGHLLHHLPVDAT